MNWYRELVTSLLAIKMMKCLGYINQKIHPLKGDSRSFTTRQLELANKIIRGIYLNWLVKLNPLLAIKISFKCKANISG